MRGEPAQPKSEPVKEPETATATDYNTQDIRMFALQLAKDVRTGNAGIEQLLTDAKAIELYLKGEAE